MILVSIISASTACTSDIYGENGGEIDTTNPQSDDNRAPEAAELQDGVHYFNQVMMTGAEVHSDRLVFPRASRAWFTDVDVGDVLISDIDHGFLRRIIAIEEVDDTLVVNTEEALLTDALASAELHQNFDQARFIDPVTRELVVDFGIDINVGRRTLLSQDGLNVVLDGGIIRFQPSVALDLRLARGQLDFFQILAEGQIEADLLLTATASRAFNRTRSFTTNVFRTPPKVFVQFVGGVPVVEVISAVVDANVSVQANASGTISAGTSVQAGVATGLRFAEGRLAPIGDANLALDPIGPELNINGNVRVRAALEPKIEVLFFGTAGVSMGLGAFAELSANTALSGSAGGSNIVTSCQITPGLSGRVEAELALLNLPGVGFNLFNFRSPRGCDLRP